jgi:hypothetical protein
MLDGTQGVEGMARNLTWLEEIIYPAFVAIGLPNGNESLTPVNELAAQC